MREDAARSPRRSRSLQIAQLAEHQSLAEVVANHLRTQIIGGAHAQGEHLIEREIAQSLGVSSIPVREAFGRLVEEGLVVRIPRRGAFVAPLTAEGINDLTRVRIALEQLAVELAIEHWTPQAHAAAQQIVEGMRQAARDGDQEAFFRLDQQFHEHFWDVANSATLAATAANLRGRISRFLRVATVRDRTALERSADDHQRWVDAVGAGDVVRAHVEVQLQISSAAQRILAQIQSAT